MNELKLLSLEIQSLQLDYIKLLIKKRIKVQYKMRKTYKKDTKFLKFLNERTSELEFLSDVLNGKGKI